VPVQLYSIPDALSMRYAMLNAPIVKIDVSRVVIKIMRKAHQNVRAAMITATMYILNASRSVKG